MWKIHNNGIIIDIFSADGPLIDTLEYDSEDILTNKSKKPNLTDKK